MALTPEQKKKLLIGGGVGALALVVGFAIFGGGKAAAAPAISVQDPRRITPPQRIPARDLERRRKKRRRDDDDNNERGARGENGERDKCVENGRGEYRKKHKNKGRPRGH